MCDTLTEVTTDIDLKKINGGTFTVKSIATGEHRTFKVRQKQDTNQDPVAFVSLLSGPDNESDYIPFAVLNSYGLFAFKKYHGTQYQKLTVFLSHLPEHLEAGRVKLYHSGRCLRCGRKLTTPESITTGIGPVCAGR